MIDRVWDGSQVKVCEDRVNPNKPISVQMSPMAARTLALTLGRIKQTTLTLPGDAQELLTALDYVMVGDPNSRRQHDGMEAAKGMTPDGGYKEPENRPRRSNWRDKEEFGPRYT